MRVPAIVLATVLSAASMWGQAIVGYAGASAASGTAATGSASKVGDSAMSGLHNKMSAAMGQPAGSGGQGSSSDTHVHAAPADSGVHSQMHSGMQCKEMKSGAHSMAGKQCKGIHGANMQGKAACCRRSKDGKMAHEMECCKHGNCAHEKKAAGTEGAAKDTTAKQTTQNQEMKITVVGAKK